MPALKEDYPWAQVVEAKPLKEADLVSSSITQTWTDQAIKCYMTNADCANCSIPRGDYNFSCQMDKVVPVLVENLGKPDPRRVNKLSAYLYD